MSISQDVSHGAAFIVPFMLKGHMRRVLLHVVPTSVVLALRRQRHEDLSSRSSLAMRQVRGHQEFHEILCFVLLCLEIESYYIALAGLEFTM